MATVTDPKLKEEILELFNKQNQIIESDIPGSKKVTSLGFN